MSNSKKANQHINQLNTVLSSSATSLYYLHDGVFITDLSGLILDWNPSAERIFGYQKKEILGKTPAILHSPEESLKLTKKILDGVKNNGFWKGDINFVRKDSSEGICETTVSPVFDDNEIQIGTIGINYDISERKIIEKSLLESNERFQLLAKVTKDGVWDANLETGTVWWNDAYNKLFGKRPTDSKQSWDWWFDHIHPDDVERIKQSVTEAIEGTGNYWRNEYQYRKENSDYLDILDRAHFSRNNDGKVIRIIGLMYDQTERKAFERKIQNYSHTLGKEVQVRTQELNEEINQHKLTEERYSLAMKGANDGLWDWDLLNDTVYYSPRWKSMLGHTEDEIDNHFSEWKRLLHPDDIEIALSNIENFLNHNVDKYESEFRMQHKDGHYVHILARAFAVENNEGKVTRLVGTHIDITDRKHADEKITFQASHDALTELVNRREFERRAERMISTVQKNEHALCFLDLDQFKVVNDTCGHAAGDEMLRQISEVLENNVRHRDTLARLGGDEFGILMEHCSLESAYRVSTSLRKAIQDFQFSWEEHSFRITVSIGLVPVTESTANLKELLSNADAACFIAKDKGRNHIHVHHAEDTELEKRHGEMQWVTRIQKALDENRFCLFAQSIEPLDKFSDSHCELLIRMKDEQDKIIPPGAFLPSAERYCLMTKIDGWVVSEAFGLLINNTEFLKKVGFCAINLSGQSLADIEFQEFVINKFKDSDIPAGKICFEITETAAITNLSAAKSFIEKMKELGCLFSLDDFGSGLSSFGYLKNMDVDYLKIDGMFVKDIVDDSIDYAMVKSINEIGQVMGMKTIAEFVETDAIKKELGKIGVNYVQGYGISKPKPFKELLAK